MTEPSDDTTNPEPPTADLSEHDDAGLPHPPATATEELDEGVAAETESRPEQGTSPGVG